MKEMTSTVTIHRSAHDVFDFVLNPQNTPRWVEGVVLEKASERPARLGTIYENQSKDGSWATFEIIDFWPDKLFIMTKRGTSVQVVYALQSLLDGDQCELTYTVRAHADELGERFTPATLNAVTQKLKTVIEPRQTGESCSLTDAS